MLTRILLPLDASDLSDRLLNRVAHLDLAEDAEVVLVRSVTGRASRGQERKARESLARKADVLHERGLRVRTVVLAGEPARRILECAADCGATLIAMLLRGRVGPPAWRRGSVAERVLRESPIPVLLDHPAAPEPCEPGAFRRLLVPIDPGSRGSSDHVLSLVVALARRQDSVVQLLAVLDERPEADTLTRRAEAEACLEAAHARLGGIAALKRVAVGSPELVILQAAADEDILVIGAQRDPRSSRTRFGLTAEGVLRRCPCAVLVVPRAPTPRVA